MDLSELKNRIQKNKECLWRWFFKKRVDRIGTKTSIAWGLG